MVTDRNLVVFVGARSTPLTISHEGNLPRHKMDGNQHDAMNQIKAGYKAGY